jgi:hypothetical protein
LTNGNMNLAYFDFKQVHKCKARFQVSSLPAVDDVER